MSRRDLFPGQTGKAIDNMGVGFSSLDVGEGVFKLKNLIQVRPIQEIMQLAADRDGPFLDTPMALANGAGCLEILGKV